MAEAFVAQFYAIEGITLGERRRSLFKLLEANASLKQQPQILDAIVTNLAPVTYLQTLHKLEVLLYFRRSQELLELLKEGNDVVISKIGQQSWFYKSVFNGIPAVDIVNDVLPCMSFSIRMKILNKMSRYCDHFDEIFDEVKARYGFNIAKKFITSCSPMKIKEVLSENLMRFTATQLKSLWKKDSSLIKLHVEKGGSYIKDSEYRSLIKSIYKEDPELFKYLQTKYSHLKVQLGHRLTKQFVANNREDIIKNPHQFSNLKKKTVIRKLGWDAITFFRNSLPEDKSDFFRNQFYLRDYPNKFHYKLYTKISPQHYHMDFADHPEFINNYLLKLIPNKEERAQLALVKVNQGKDDYLKYLPIEQSIPKIMEKINLTSDIGERANFVKALIETCYINDDTDSVLQIMKYFYKRHKNDDINVHIQFINNIENIIGFKKFTEEMWAQLNDLLLIHILKFDQDVETYKKIQTLALIKFNKGISHHQKLSYLEFLFNKEEPIDDLLYEYVTSDHLLSCYGQYDKKFEKYVLLYVIDNCEKIFQNRKSFCYCSYFIGEFNAWNRAYPDDPLSIFAYSKLADYFNQKIVEGEYINALIVNLFRQLIFTKEKNNDRRRYLQIYWNNVKNFHLNSHFFWFLQFEPLQIVENFDRVMETMLEKSDNNYLFWYTIKKFTHLHLDTKLMDFCLSKLNDEQCLEQKSKFIPPLSIILPAEKYSELANIYKPASIHLNLTNETEVRRYNLQLSLAGNFKHSKSHKVLPSLLQFCIGDYFKQARKSLYSILYHTPENMLIPHLNYLSKKAVSVRKHALYLTCELTTTKRVEDILKLLNESESVESLQKYIFQSTLRYFVKNPSNEFYDLVKLTMLFIKKMDDESLDAMTTSLYLIPEKYKGAYFQYTWDFLEKIIDSWDKLARYENKLISRVDTTTIKQLPYEFVLKLIKERFCSEYALNFHSLSKLIFEFFENCQVKEEFLQAILGIIKNFDEEQKMNFYHDWYYKIMSKNFEQKNVEAFINFFNEEINPIENFHDYVKLFYLRLKVELGEYSQVELFSAKLYSFLMDLKTSYGPYIMPLFVKEATEFFSLLEIPIYDYLGNLLTNYPTVDVAIFVIDSITKPDRINNDIWKFKKIVRQIQDINDASLQIVLNSRFKDYLKSKEYLLPEVAMDTR